MSRNSKIASVGGLTAIAVMLALLGWGISHRQALPAANAEAAASPPKDSTALVDLSNETPGHLRVTDEGMEKLKLQIVEVQPAPPPEPIKLPGTLLLDSNRLVRVHSRFAGEVVRLGTTQPDPAHPEQGPPHQLRYGDRVVKNQLLAVVSSKDIGEKKSELVAALAQKEIDGKLLAKYEEVTKGAVPERTIQETRRKLDADLVAVAKAERTLRSWRLTEDEIDEIYREAQRVQNREQNDPHADRTWAEFELRAPIDGLIVEKNFNEGDMIDPSQDLFKVADLSRVLVLANAYEEDLPLLRSLRPEQRIWRVDIKADPNDVPIAGSFDIVGAIIDPSQHAGSVMGSLDNSDGRYSIGEFITATIDLPADPSLVEVPTSALVDDDNPATIYIETDPAKHEFAARKVAVVRRGRERAYIRAVPLPAERSDGAESLALGEHVVASGAVELAAQLKHMRRGGAALPHTTSTLTSR